MAGTVAIERQVTGIVSFDDEFAGGEFGGLAVNPRRRPDVRRSIFFRLPSAADAIRLTTIERQQPGLVRLFGRRCRKSAPGRDVEFEAKPASNPSA